MLLCMYVPLEGPGTEPQRLRQQHVLSLAHSAVKENLVLFLEHILEGRVIPPDLSLILKL